MSIENHAIEDGSHTDDNEYWLSPEGEYARYTPGEVDKIAVETTEWAVDHLPWLYRNLREEQLEPEKYPEDRVLLDFVQRRDFVRRFVAALLGPENGTKNP